ncbi:unnamed protein product [Ambrosiozyma monospora]|uniref:Unnamed protein product n=1 Tax=Ambrosiozyma monospora TaxID=43982 RepID=A0ACB5THK9_AMBMO|nr:unnamed protein product [Ambrosiozyma monospora]
MVDMISLLYYYPVAFSFESLSSSDKSARCNIKRFPVFEQDAADAKFIKNMILPFHSNTYWNCLMKAKQLNSNNIDRYVDILLDFEDADDYSANTNDSGTTTKSSSTDTTLKLSHKRYICHPIQNSFGYHRNQLFFSDS